MDCYYAQTQSRIDSDIAMKLYKEGCTDKEISAAFIVSDSAVIRWRKVNNLPPNLQKEKDQKRKNESEPYLADVKRCKTCEYWGLGFCNHLLETGKRRVYEGSHCKSHKKRREES